MVGIPPHFLSVFFILGLLTVMAYAWQRFNEPSFPNKETLPHAVEPLRYLFLKPAYRKARLTYLAVSLGLYCILVWPGPSMIEVLEKFGLEKFPPQAWALLVALFMVGLAPNSNMKWLTMIEDHLRRIVHGFFLVPDGIEKTIGILEDARYDPPPSQLNAIPSPQKERLREDLKLSTGTLQYRWARATMLMASLRQMGAGAAHPLRRAAFEPFQEDFNGIVEKYRALKQDIEALRENPTNSEGEENLVASVDNLLKRIYAYISWGIRHQADNEGAVDETLEELGFRVPQIGGRRLFDIVAPAAGFVAGITIIFWLTVDFVDHMISADGNTLSGSVLYALSAGMAAGLMYGFAAIIALQGRAAQIERKVWREYSPRCLMPIAIKAGLVTWIAIVASTVLWRLPATLQSLTGMAEGIKSIAGGAAMSGPSGDEWKFLPIKIATAMPWLLAGATVSAVLASSMGSDVRRTDRRQRIRDALILSGALGVAAVTAQLIQASLQDLLQDRSSFDLVPIVGLAGAVCGAVIGYMVPQACRANLVTPPDPIMARALRELLKRAETALGTRAAAEDWVFTPLNELGGITPAEAIQNKTHATGVGRFLDQEAARRREEISYVRTERPAPVLIEGGRGSERPAASVA